MKRKRLPGYLILLVLACIFLTVQQALADVVIDNGDPGTSFTGTWLVSSGTKYFGADSVWARDGATYTWQMGSQPAGVYEVFLSWSELASRATSIAVNVTDLDGTHTVSINQKLNAGKWNSLGQYRFGPGGTVTITAANGSTVSTSADAVWFKFLPDDGSEVILDNRDPGTSQTGTWDVSGGYYPYGPDSVWSRDGAAFTWTFAPPQSGRYAISLWWSSWASRSAAIPVDIDHAAGTARVIVDQQRNGGMWNLLGTYSFEAGNAYRVTITSQAAPSSTSADGIKFAYASTNAPPELAPIGNRAVNEGGLLEFTVSATDPDGHALTYSAGNLPQGASFDPAARTFSWTPVSGQAGVYGNVLFTVTDNGTPPASDFEAITITVTGSGTINLPPVAVIDTILPNPATAGENVGFTGHGADSDGTVTGYLWTSSISGQLSTEPSFLTAALPAGTHAITFRVQDNAGAWSDTATAALTVTAANLPPQAVIDSIAPNPAKTSSAVAFTGHGTDSDGTISGYLWSSSISGQLSTAPSFTAAALPAGTHAITFRVQDNAGAWSDTATAALTVTAENLAPQAVIDAIAPNPAKIGSAVAFTGHGADSDGTISGYLWSSSISGQLSTVPSFTAASLPAGTHAITFRVQDNAGAWSDTAAAALTVTAANLPPQAVIDAITPGLVNIGDLVTLTGHGTDDDGTIRRYSWDSNISGHLGDTQAHSLSFLSKTSIGNHTITLTVTDNSGATATASQTLTVQDATTETGVLRHKWTATLGDSGQILPVMGDIDKDGDQELVMTTTKRVIAVNGRTGQIEWSVPCNTACYGYAAELVDLDRDGTPEVLYGAVFYDHPRVYALNGNGSVRWFRDLSGDFMTLFPVIAYDIDGDGYPEIWAASEDQDPSPYNGHISDYNGALTMLDHNGTILATRWVHHPCWGGMALADTDFDGTFEVYLSDRRTGYLDFPANGLQAFNAHTLEPLWSRPDIQHSSPMPVIADVFPGGPLEVVATAITRAGPLVLNAATGETVPGYDYSSKRLPTHGTPTVYDIDGDGRMEYITASSYPTNAAKNFVVFDLISGAIDFQANYDIWAAWPPKVGDVNGDGRMEILVATGNQPDVVGDTADKSYPLLVYDMQYNLIDMIRMPNGTGQLTPARVYDTDGDGYNEVVVPGYYGKLKVYDTDALTPHPAPRTWVQFYSEYRRGAAEYVHPPVP